MGDDEGRMRVASGPGDRGGDGTTGAVAYYDGADTGKSGKVAYVVLANSVGAYEGDVPTGCGDYSCPGSGYSGKAGCKVVVGDKGVGVYDG